MKLEILVTINDEPPNYSAVLNDIAAQLFDDPPRPGYTRSISCEGALNYAADLYASEGES